jgi:hypothetical protein
VLSRRKELVAAVLPGLDVDPVCVFKAPPASSIWPSRSVRVSCRRIFPAVAELNAALVNPVIDECGISTWKNSSPRSNACVALPYGEAQKTASALFAASAAFLFASAASSACVFCLNSAIG